MIIIIIAIVIVVLECPVAKSAPGEDFGCHGPCVGMMSRDCDSASGVRGGSAAPLGEGATCLKSLMSLDCSAGEAPLGRTSRCESTGEVNGVGLGMTSRCDRGGDLAGDMKRPALGCCRGPDPAGAEDTASRLRMRMGVMSLWATLGDESGAGEKRKARAGPWYLTWLQGVPGSGTSRCESAGDCSGLDWPAAAATPSAGLAPSALPSLGASGTCGWPRRRSSSDSSMLTHLRITWPCGIGTSKVVFVMCLEICLAAS